MQQMPLSGTQVLTFVVFSCKLQTPEKPEAAQPKPLKLYHHRFQGIKKLLPKLLATSCHILQEKLMRLGLSARVSYYYSYS